MLHPAVRRHGLGWRAVELRALGGTRAAGLPLATARHGGEGGEGGRAGLLPVRQRAGPARRGQLRGGRVLAARLPPPHPYRPARRLLPHRHAAHLAARPVPMRTAAHVVANRVEEAALRSAQLRLQEGLRSDAGVQAGCVGLQAGCAGAPARSPDKAAARQPPLEAAPSEAGPNPNPHPHPTPTPGGTSVAVAGAITVVCFFVPLPSARATLRGVRVRVRVRVRAPPAF